MSALILKSGNALDFNVVGIDYALYKKRVIEDGGTIFDEGEATAAISYARANKLSVFSATSPRWGAKIGGGKVRKLYSLFGEAGDLEVTSALPELINYDTTSYAYPTIELLGSSSNYLRSKGLVGNHVNSVLYVISRMKSDATLGTNQGFSRASLIDYTINNGSDKRVHMLKTSRRTASSPVNDMNVTATAFGNNGSIVTPTTTSATEWSGTASYLKKDKLVTYNNGVFVAEDTTLGAQLYNTDLSLFVGVERGAADTLVLNNPFVGNIAEVWCLVNTLDNSAQLLSSRASQKYNT